MPVKDLLRRLQVVVLRGLNLPIDGELFSRSAAHVNVALCTQLDARSGPCADAAKVPDFMPLKNKTSLQALPLYGTSIARVLFTWEAFEPERGQYNMEYLDYYLGLVEVTSGGMLGVHAARTHPTIVAARGLYTHCQPMHWHQMQAEGWEQHRKRWLHLCPPSAAGCSSWLVKAACVWHIAAQALYELGILTIVDMHQDFYSRYLNIGCGEGFPK